MTWSSCPRCGVEAAVGWRWVGDEDGAARAVEYDCRGGCRLTAGELVAVVRDATRPDGGITRGTSASSPTGPPPTP